MMSVNDLSSIYNEKDYLHSVTPKTPMQFVVNTCVCCSSHWPMKNVIYSNAHTENMRVMQKNQVVLTCEGM